MLGLITHFLALTLLAYIGQASASDSGPSFDCAKAHEGSEKIICGSETLSALDRELASIYPLRLAELDEAGRAALKRDEKRWVDRRMRFCAPPSTKGDAESRAACIEDEYRQRISVLRADCEVDQENSLEQMAAWKQARAWERPRSKKVPKGFTVKRDVEMYWNLEHVSVYNLPSTTLPEASTSTWGMRCCGEWLSSCKATGPDGSEWLVFVSGEILEYAPLHAVEWGSRPNLEASSIYDERQRREYKERQERRKQLQ